MAYIKRKSNGSYLITVSCGRDAQDKKITRSTTFKPELYTAKGNLKTEKTIEKEVTAFAAEFENQILNGSYTSGNKITLERYSEKYLHEYAEQYQAPKTLESTRTYIKLFVNDFGYMTLDKITPMFLQEYVNKMFKERKHPDKPETISHSTVKRRMAVLSSMLSQAVRWNFITSNPMDRVQVTNNKIESIPEKTMCFTQEQASAFISALDDPLIYKYHKDSGNQQEYTANHEISIQLKLFFYLAMFTGCRRGEALALTWSDFDFTNCVIHISKSVTRVNGDIIIKATKTKGSVRTIAVPDAVMDIAKQWKANQKQYAKIIGSKWEGSDFVFIRWNGKQMGLETPYQAFRRIISNYNANRQPHQPELPLIPLHGLRHTAATLLITSGVDIRTISGRLGHANTSTTLNIYAEFLKETDRTAANKLENLLIKGS